jgi:hypothetical protein
MVSDVVTRFVLRIFCIDGALGSHAWRDEVYGRQEQAMHRISHPISYTSKWQVRAYMRRREQALQPPPPPDEIRRQLAWCKLDAGMDASCGATAASAAALGWHLTVEMARLGTLFAVAWLIDSSIPQRKN